MNPWKGLRNIPHNVWILSFATLINRSGTMVLPFLAIYMIKVIGLSAASAGIVLTLYGLGGLITAPLVGRLSDKIGALRVMKVSLLLTGIMLFGFPFLKNYYLILGYTFVWSVIGEAFRPANLALISDEANPRERKVSFALNRLAINLGMSIGPVVGGFLTSYSFNLLFYVDGITSILAALFLMITKFEKRFSIDDNVVEAENVKAKPVAAKSVLKDKRFLLFMLSILPINLIFFQHFGAMPIYLVRDLGFKESVYGLLTLVNTVLIIFVEVPLNNKMSNWKDKYSTAFGGILGAIGFGAMAFSGDINFLIITIVIWTFGEMIFFPSIASLASDLSPEKRRGEYMGYFQMTFSTAFMLGPLIGTIVLDAFGSVVLWTGSFLVGAIATISILIFNKDKS